MAKGILLGILMQFISAVGYLAIINITSIESEAFRTSLMIIFAGVVALGVAIYSVVSGKQALAAIQPKEYILIAVGSVLVMFVAQVVCFLGAQMSSMTTMGFTMLAFPLIMLGLELALGRVKFSSLGMHELAGFLLMAAGYVAVMTKPQAG